MARTNDATADLYHEPINWGKVAKIGVPILAVAGIGTFIGVSTMKGDRTETAVKEPATHVYSGPVEGTVPQGPPIVAKYDPSNINQVASAFVTYVRDGNKKGLKDVTLGMSGSDYQTLSSGKIETFEITGSKEISLPQSQKELTLKEYGIQFDKTAIIDIRVKLDWMDDPTGVRLDMGYSAKTDSWYVTNVF
jgi:hypothetical protein